MEVAVGNIGDTVARNIKIEAILPRGIETCRNFTEGPQATQTVPDVQPTGSRKTIFQLLSGGPAMTIVQRLFDSSVSIGNNSLTAKVTYDGLETQSLKVLQVKNPTLVFSSFGLSKNKVGLDGGEVIDVNFKIDNKGDTLPRIDVTLLAEPSAFDVIQGQKFWINIGKDGSTGDATFQLKTKKVAADSSYYVTLVAKHTTEGRTHTFVKRETVSFRGGCLIATAAFGSPLAPQVQFLREFRDFRIRLTFAGTEFLTVFNRFYYSFSPQVSQVLTEHESQRGIVRMLIYPLIVSLELSENLWVLTPNPEIAVVITGVLASSLIGIAYFLPLVLCCLLTKRIRSHRAPA